MPLTRHSTVLIPVDVSGEVALPDKVLDLLATVDVVLLGYYPVPSQAAPAQIKHQHGSEATDRLKSLTETLAPNVASLTEQLVFTHDRGETIDRIAEEYDCDAVLTLGPIDVIERIFVPLRGDANIDRILNLVADLLRASDASVTLFHSLDEDTDAQYGETLLDDAISRLTAEGIDSDRIEQQVSEKSDTGMDIIERGRGSDVFVLGETEPSLRERILGAIPIKIIDETETLVFVVRDTDQ